MARRSARVSVVAAVALALGLAAVAASGAEYASIGAAAAILYDGPSDKSRRMFVAPRGMPVEVVARIDRWAKVRDVAGDVLWVASRDLVPGRTVIVVTAAPIRQQAQDAAPAVFQAERGVVLDLLEGSVPGWARVRHRDGGIGFVRVSDVWGL